MNQVALANRQVMMRVDMNVPIHEGAVSDDQRIRACLPDIETALEAGAALSLISHLGRPKAGDNNPAFSLQPVASHLSKLLGKPVPLVSDYSGDFAVQPGEVVMYENIRFQSGELEDDDTLAKHLANLCDIYVIDAHLWSS
ncbi:MAG: phosphoglycerate kinase [Bacteroidetes bacterium]|nr:phosphoglycerate kinase [Bacteroidota bacterium]